MDLRDFRTKITVETDQVLEGISRATGKDKSLIAREWMAERAIEELHKATMVLRLANRKGTDAA